MKTLKMRDILPLIDNLQMVVVKRADGKCCSFVRERAPNETAFLELKVKKLESCVHAVGVEFLCIKCE